MIAYSEAGCESLLLYDEAKSHDLLAYRLANLSQSALRAVKKKARNP
jgi:hypothetical protein